MSEKVVAWVWNYPDIDSNELLVLLAIAQVCDDEGTCNTTVNFIANMCGLEPFETELIINRLERHEILSRLPFTATFELPAYRRDHNSQQEDDS